ncbi:hypothetical protein PK69_13060 [Xanthomonas phaseoli pv. phaseoli]|uniref:F-box domain-containing protein n=2 Tax=Xanthomonas campestris pv. phaseoli TaxID=317013 RepID=A0AB34QIR9_XANCH|nr:MULTISPECIES: hypothetical protein [Xanthomonas]ATS23132.1 hypothetical protein XppCFBP412P_18250 [Xanthomonas phaseoli pv. phaseoli]ATS26029.1 hypothetical protein XppCFBP6164P_11190 [Xanthomonas phaseoli pv. phaseoli]ATS30477.1 hypothetical protein XppCFBP6546P_12500 [Xanthomonas phaseoli pv. phaseoli]ATS34288.1 hypothetical protein XppCFBP6982P_10655 [Xanthomonas phaseoli pv. phaseoli]AZU15300.1 hypothetical protein AC609_22100 [Xanthomonas phaseoli pv. phaseoli]
MLHDYALGTIFDHCDLRELARMSQVDRRSRNLAALTFQKRWTAEKRRQQVIDATLSDQPDALHFAHRMSMTIDDVRVRGETLLSRSLAFPLHQHSYRALLAMTNNLHDKIVTLQMLNWEQRGFVFGAIYNHCQEAIKAILACTRFQGTAHPELRRRYFVDAIHYGDVATLRVLVDSGRFDVNATYRGQSLLWHEMATPDQSLDKLHYLLGLDGIDVHARGLPAAPCHADLAKYRLYLSDPRVDVNKPCRPPNYDMEVSALTYAANIAMIYDDTRIFDVLIADPRLNILQRYRHSSGSLFNSIETLRHAHRGDDLGDKQRIFRYLESRMLSHPSFRTSSA